ncbi:NAD(+)/NADH kinase [soil metagenome]
MTTVAVFVHTGRSDAVALGAEVARWLVNRGHRVMAPAAEADLIAGAGGPTPLVDGSADPVDLVVTIGGDGTMLRGTRRAVIADADVLGVNLGQLGYLTEVEAGAWEPALVGYLAGDHQIAARLVLASRLTRLSHGAGDGPGEALPTALNEVIIEKQAMGRTVRLGVTLDGKFFTSYVADGVILATPTGSTAYSLSARGPVVDPQHRAILLTAVSPHSLFDRSLVLEPSSEVEVTVLGDRPAAVAVDGEHMRALPPGATVTVNAAERPARFVTFGGGDFHRTLKVKFGLNDR